MSDGEKESSGGWRSPERREELRERIDRYADVPLAIASIVLVLLSVIELTGDVEPPWTGRIAFMIWVLWALFVVEFVVKFTLAPVKRRYLRRNWLDLLVVLLPVLRILLVFRVLAAARALPALRLLVFGGRGSGAAIQLLRRRRLGQLALVTVLVILLGAGLGYLLEAGATDTVPGAAIDTFGDALWWAAAIVTTVGSQLSPVTPGGRFLGFGLMIYGMAVFTYFTASIASVLIGTDVQHPPDEDEGEDEDGDEGEGHPAEAEAGTGVSDGGRTKPGADDRERSDEEPGPA